MNFIKKHKYTVILLIIFAILIVIGSISLNFLLSDSNASNYGERLKDIDNYPIDQEIFTKIEDDFTENKNVKILERRLQGKVLNFYITVNDNVSVNDSKALGNKIITYFDEKTLSYYSIQIFLLKEDESLNNFPIIGMKDPLSKVIVWTKDREITNESDDTE